MLRRAAIAACFLACDAGGLVYREPPPPATAQKPAPTPLPPLLDVKTTVDTVLFPHTPIAEPVFEKDPALPGPLEEFLNKGFGELEHRVGEPYLTRTIDGSTPPAPGPNAHRLVRFAHLADLQIGDDESPTKLGIFDDPDVLSSVARPQDAYLCRMANAAVRTINALHAKDPIAFTLMGGDNADSAQANEIDWVLGILSGAPSVECDSGDDDEIDPGPDNDGKDPFVAEGLKMPWRWVTGNHDVLVQGNLKVSQYKDRVLGNDSTGGARHYENGKRGIIEEGPTVIPDPRRALLSRVDLLTKVAGDKDGHGLAASTVASAMATYTFDVEGTPLRFLVLDTAHDLGGSEGVITRREVDRAIRPLLDQAKAEGKWVMLASHHATTSLGDGQGVGGQQEPDALTTDDWQKLVGGYDNVIFSFVGHSHRHRVSAITPAGRHPWWEVMTAAIADWPHQFRTIELFDQDDGWLMLRATCMDFATEGDPVALQGKKRGVVDVTAGWLRQGDIPTTDRNVEIWIKKP